MLAPLGVFIVQPWLALIPGAVLLGLYRLSRRRIAAAAALAWLCYALYEYGMQRRFLCSGECDIRIDLLVLYPILTLWSFSGVALSLLTMMRRQRSTS